MWLPRQWKERRADKARIRTLTTEIDRVWASEYEGATDKNEGYQLARSITMYDENERDWLLQKPLSKTIKKIGLVVPREYYDHDYSWPSRTILTQAGVWWAKKQINDYKMGRAKDLVVIIMPILSLLLSSAIAILGLLVALKKK